MSTGLLMQVAAAIAGGQIKVIDLTQTLRPSTPVIGLPPPLANSNPFSISVISHYDDRGPGWYWNNISMGEHTGTHFDAPVHWVTGQQNPEGYTDTIPVRRMVAPAVVIDCSKEAAADEKFLLEPSHFQAWETRHGRIPDGSWVLMRTDWSKREDPACARPERGGHALAGGQSQRQRLGRGSRGHRRRPGVRLRADVSGAQPHARVKQIRSRQLVQSRPVAADRLRSDHHPAQD
jgi:hypothetical protein